MKPDEITRCVLPIDGFTVRAPFVWPDAPIEFAWGIAPAGGKPVVRVKARRRVISMAKYFCAGRQWAPGEAQQFRSWWRQIMGGPNAAL